MECNVLYFTVLHWIVLYCTIPYCCVIILRVKAWGRLCLTVTRSSPCYQLTDTSDSAVSCPEVFQLTNPATRLQGLECCVITTVTAPVLSVLLLKCTSWIESRTWHMSLVGIVSDCASPDSGVCQECDYMLPGVTWLSSVHTCHTMSWWILLCPWIYRHYSSEVNIPGQEALIEECMSSSPQTLSRLLLILCLVW